MTDQPGTDQPAAAADRVEPAVSLGLRPRPDLPPDVVAVVTAAVEAAWPRAVAYADEKDPAHAVWRFSGRWWNKPVPMRRDRPFASR